MNSNQLFSVIALGLFFSPGFSQVEKGRINSAFPGFMTDSKRINMNINKPQITNSENKPDSVYSYYYYSDNDSVWTNKKAFDYNETGLLIRIREYQVIDNQISSDPFYDEKLFYNADNLLDLREVAFIDYDRPGEDTLLPATKYQFRYNNNKQLIAKYWFTWNFEDAIWFTDTAYMEEYQYNEYGKIDLMTAFMFGTENERIPNEQVNYTLDPEFLTEVQVKQIYYNWSDQWGKSDSIIINYNSDNLCILKEEYLFNSTDNVWDKMYSTQYSYNSDGEPEWIRMGWYLTGEYVQMYEYRYTYNSEENTDFELDFIWDTENGVWKKLNAYQSFYSPKSEIHQSHSLSNINVYPNPTHFGITIKNLPEKAEIEILDLYGTPKMKISNPLGLINISGLPKGVYILSISDKMGQNFRQTIIKN